MQARAAMQNPAPVDLADCQYILDGDTGELRERRGDERTKQGEEGDYSKFIIAAPVGVRVKLCLIVCSFINLCTCSLAS